MTETFLLEPLDVGFGAELVVDLRAPRDGADDDRLRAALAAHGLLVLRQPGVPHDDLARFAGVFGPLLPVGAGGQMEQYVSNVRPDGTLGSAEIVWHSDTSFAPEPYRGLCLYALDVVAEASSTRFVSA